MNITKSRADERMRKIQEISAIVKQHFNEDMDVDYEKLIMHVCVTQRVARRTAMEYIKIALFNIDHRHTKLDGRKLISDGTKIGQVAEASIGN